MVLTEDEKRFVTLLVQRIDYLRSEQGMTLYQLAQKATLSENTIKSLCKRKSYPNLLTLNRICEALGITLSEFFLYEDGNMRFTKAHLDLIKNYEKVSLQSKALLVELTKLLK
ncbi:MAG: helix-turn-helix transcriptional regulator [Clostridia bacterium]|nr:helix-turn-helix transcriptional regulator [Clostridia bacterium]